MKNIRYLLLVLGIISGFGLAMLPTNTSAVSVFDSACTSDPTSVLCQQQKNNNFTSSVQTIVNTLLYVLGAVAVIVIIIGGIKYTTSMGDSKNVESAKNTILYAVVGLVVALLAYAIVNFVLTSIK